MNSIYYLEMKALLYLNIQQATIHSSVIQDVQKQPCSIFGRLLMARIGLLQTFL